MATTTRATFRTRVARNVQGRSDLTSEIDDAINDALVDISQRAAWKELQARTTSTSTVAGTQTVAVPTGAEELQLVQVNDDALSWNLRLVGKLEAEALLPIAAEHSSGKPELGYVENGLLYLVPVPQKAWVLHITYRAQLTLAAGDTAQISAAGFDSLVIALATALVFETLEFGERSAGRWWDIYEQRVARKLRSQAMDGKELRVDTRLGNAAERPRPGNGYIAVTW